MMSDICHCMHSTLAAAAEAIFTIMSVPMLQLCQSTVAMDKWCLLVVSYCLILLSLLFHTHKMIIRVMEEYKQGSVELVEQDMAPWKGSIYSAWD